MKLTINTSFKSVEVANYVLNMALAELEEKAFTRRYLDLSKTDIKFAKRFLKSSGKALVSEYKKEVLQ